MESSAYDELTAYTLTHGYVEFIHQHVVDAQGASVSIADSKPIRVFFSLAGLYLHVERGFSGRQVQDAHLRLARTKREWPRFVAPTTLPTMSANEVMGFPTGEERDAAILRWCRSVWETWAPEHERIRHETDA